MRHYTVWIDADSIVPNNSKMVSAQVKALEKDPAAILITDMRSAYHAASMGLAVIQFHYLPAGNTVMVAPILPTSVYEHIQLAAPFPWTASPQQAIAAARFSIGENDRKKLYPLPKHGLI